MPLLANDSSRPRWFRRLGPRTCLVFLVVVLAGYRLTLIDRGHFFWGDEQRYVDAEAFVNDLEAGEYRAAAGRLNERTCRPVFTLINAIPALAQRHLNPMLGINPDTLQYYDIASAFNVLLTLGITICVWGIARAWMRCPWYALLVATVFSLLCYANVWIRHLMPYSASLLLFLAALWLLSSESRTGRQALVRPATAGVLSACAYTCYSGYYAFALLNLVVLLATQPRRLRALLLYGGSAAMVFAAVELLARFTGGSYFLGTLSFLEGAHRHTLQGHSAEGFVFVWRYLRYAEGAIGVVLFVLFVACGVLLLWRRKADISPLARAGILAAIACYVLHASASVLTLQTRFFGRILGMYLPFLVCGAVLALKLIPAVRLRRAAVGGLIAVSLWSFAAFASQYAHLVYPADLLAKTMAERGRTIAYSPVALWGHPEKVPDVSVEAVDPAVAMVVDTVPEGYPAGVRSASHEKARAGGARFIGVNFKWMLYVFEKDHRFSAPDDYRIIAQVPHPNALRATGYEMNKPWERKRLRNRLYTMRIYERIDDRSAITSIPETGTTSAAQDAS